MKKTKPERCPALAKRGTGTGTCDRPLDEHGRCDNPRDHLDDVGGVG